jgi:transcription termination/antitermination protein NusG
MVVLTSSNDADRVSWFAVRTLSRHEKLVRDQLAKRNVEHFLPTTKRLTQWTDRKKEVEVPLFPGYCFARLRWEDRLTVLQSQGVLCFVGSVARAEPIPDEEIDSLSKVLKNSSELADHPVLTEGMLVAVIHGPLQGVKGRLVREARYARLVLSITLIQRAIAIEIDADNVAPASNDVDLCMAR